MKFNLEICNQQSAIQEIKDLLKHENLAAIIKAWVNDKRSLVILSGQDDNTKEPQVYLLFEDKDFNFKDCEVAAAYCNQSEIFSKLPLVQQFIPPVSTRKAFDFDSVCQADQKFFKQRKKLLKFKWNGFLQADVCSIDSAVMTVVGLALTTHGETTFRKANLEWVEEDDDFGEDPQVYREHFLWAHSGRAVDNGKMFECSDYYLDLRS